MCKVVKNAKEAILPIKSGATILFGGFGLCGIPENCISAIENSDISDIVAVSCTCGVDDFGLGRLFAKKKITKMVASYVGENKIFEQQMLNGEIDVQLVPQGTLVTRIMAAGYGIPALYLCAGVGTELAEGKETREFDGRTHLLEHALDGDFAIVKAWKGDRKGNLIFHLTARNFNPLMAMAGKYTIAEVEELVEPGELDPDQIHVPGIYVSAIFQGTDYEKRIEQYTFRN